MNDQHQQRVFGQVRSFLARAGYRVRPAGTRNNETRFELAGVSNTRQAQQAAEIAQRVVNSTGLEAFADDVGGRYELVVRPKQRRSMAGSNNREDPEGSRVLMAARGAIQDDGTQLAIGAVAMLAGAELMKRVLGFAKRDLAKDGRELPPLLQQMRRTAGGSRSGPDVIEEILDQTGFEGNGARERARVRLQALPPQQLDAVYQAVFQRPG